VLDSALASLPDVHCFDRESGREAVRRVVEFAEKRFIQAKRSRIWSVKAVATEARDGVLISPSPIG